MEIRLNGKQLKKEFRLSATQSKMSIKDAEVTLKIKLTEDEYYKVYQLMDNLLGYDNFDVIIKER